MDILKLKGKYGELSEYLDKYGADLIRFIDFLLQGEYPKFCCLLSYTPSPFWKGVYS